MPDDSLNSSSTGTTGIGQGTNEGLVSAPAKSALEKTAAAQHSAPLNPSASLSMPDAAPLSPDQGVPVSTDTQPVQEETAAVPDTDKFLESILDNSTSQPQSSPTDSSAPASPEVPAPVTSPVAPLAADQTTTIPVEPIAPEPAIAPPPAANPEPTEIPVTGSQQTDTPPKIKDDIRGLDTVMNGITPPNEPSKPISENPIGAMKAQSGSGKSMKNILLVVLVIGLCVAGYFTYKMMFGGTVSDEASTNGTTGSNLSGATDEVEQQTNDEIRKQDLANIQIALQSYFSATGKYPLAETRVQLNTADNVLEKELVTAGYLSAIPSDPDSTKYYAYKSDGASFSLTAVLDSVTDTEAKVSGSLAIYEVTQDSVVTTNPNSVSSTTDSALVDQADSSTDSTVSTDTTESSINPFYPSGSTTADTGTSSSNQDTTTGDGSGSADLF